MTTIALAMIRGGILPPSFLKPIQRRAKSWPRLKKSEPKVIRVDMRTGERVQ